MQTFDAIYNRRAVKHFDPEFEFPKEHEYRLQQLIRQAPTSFNLQNYRIVMLRDKEIRQKAREIAWNQAQVTDASLCYLITADLMAWDKNPARYMENYPEDLRETYVPMIKDFYRGREWQQRDEAMRSAGLVGQTLMLAATAMGYDSCPMIGFDSDAMGKLVNMPEDHVVCMMVAVGKAIKPPRPKGGYLPHNEIFITNGF